MTDDSLTADDADRDPADIDTTIAHPARMYDYLVGGTTNFAPDREATEQAFAAFPGGVDGTRANARANREFIGRAVRYLVGEAGIRQFLDIGTGIPTEGHVHQVAQQLAPDTRVVYTDNDPIVLAHAHTLLRGTTQGYTKYADVDLRDPETTTQEAANILDFTRPIAVILTGVLHLVGDEDRPYDLVAGLAEAVPPGSYLAISHFSRDIEPEAMARLKQRLDDSSMQETAVFRSRDEIAQFFAGLEFVAPGLVPITEWRADSETKSHTGFTVPLYCGVARKS